MTDQEYEELFKAVLDPKETSHQENTIDEINANKDTIVDDSGKNSQTDVHECILLPEPGTSEEMRENGLQSQVHMANIRVVDSAAFLQQTNEVTPAGSDDEITNVKKLPKPKQCEPRKKLKLSNTEKSKRTHKVSAKSLNFAAKEGQMPLLSPECEEIKLKPEQEKLLTPNATDGKEVEMPSLLAECEDNILQSPQEMEEKMLLVNATEEGTWVQCCNSECQKWRYMSDVNDPSVIPSVWLCSMNTDQKHNDCETPEEDYDEDYHIFTNFSEGSIVWAKMAGYPWWPAMVETDPDTDVFFELESETSMNPTHYHVVFCFDKKISRAWVKTSNMCTFKNQQSAEVVTPVSVRNHGYRREIEAAKANASEALSLPVKGRMKKYSFNTRFNGKSLKIRMKKQYTSEKSVTTKRNTKNVGLVSKKEIASEDCLLSSDLLDGQPVGDILANVETVLENIEEVLDSLDSQNNDDNCNDDGIEFGKSKKKRKTDPKVDIAKIPKKKKKLMRSVHGENNAKGSSVSIGNSDKRVETGNSNGIQSNSKKQKKSEKTKIILTNKQISSSESQANDKIQTMLIKKVMDPVKMMPKRNEEQEKENLMVKPNEMETVCHEKSQITCSNEKQPKKGVLKKTSNPASSKKTLGMINTNKSNNKLNKKFKGPKVAEVVIKKDESNPTATEGSQENKDSEKFDCVLKPIEQEDPIEPIVEVSKKNGTALETKKAKRVNNKSSERKFNGPKQKLINKKKTTDEPEVVDGKMKEHKKNVPITKSQAKKGGTTPEHSENTHTPVKKEKPDQYDRSDDFGSSDELDLEMDLEVLANSNNAVTTKLEAENGYESEPLDFEE
ncbi:hypothetical protein ScPMuIL_009640 [Solemya velum]